MKQKHIFLQILGLLLVCLSLTPNCPAQSVLELVDVGNFQVKVIRKISYSKMQSFVVVIPTEEYSLYNLKTVWKYYSEKYPDKAVQLDIQIYTEATYQHNKPLLELPVEELLRQAENFRKWEAHFIRTSDRVLESGGENELLYYCPDLTKPEVMERLVLAGKDPYK